MNTGTQTYASVQKASVGPREAEAIVLKKSAFLIEQAIKAPGDEKLLREAWELTNELWSILRREALSEHCPLPPELRANMVSLAIFADKCLRKAAISENPEDLRPLAQINTHLAEGLRGNAG